MRISRETILHSLGAGTAREGKRLADAGAVRLLRVEGPEGLVFGAVAEGSGEARVAARVATYPDGQVVLSGECSVDDRGNCAHVAAVLWESRDVLRKFGDPPTIDAPVPPPPPAPPPEPEKVVPILRLFGRRDRFVALRPMAQLSFLYGTTPVGARDPREMPFRNRELEAKALARLESIGIVPETTDSESRDFVLEGIEGDGRAALELSRHELPILQDEGWRIVVDDSYPYRIVEGDARWYAEVHEETGSPWFDLEVGIEVDGKRLSLLPILLGVLSDPRWRLTPDQIASLPDDGWLPARLKDGRILPLPAARVRAILWTLAELYGSDKLSHGRALKLSRLNAPRLAELDQSLEGELEWTGGEGLRELGRRLKSFRGIAEAEVPAGFVGTLRPYQIEGLSWLRFLRDHDLSGILADDMGLGKTVMLLAHLLAEKRAGAQGPSLVVAPTSLMPNWRRESERFAPDLRVLTLQGADRHAHWDEVEHHDLVLTTYPLLPRDEARLLSRRWHLFVLDEAQFIKNPATKAARVAKKVEAVQRLCLTGTPMENHLGELWSLFHVLMPGLLGEESRFRRVFRTPIEKDGSQARRDQLAARVRPFLLRRTKEEVARELPPKTEITRLVELEGPQRDLYESIRLAMHRKVQDEVARKGLGRSTMVVLEALLRLRQVCCDPRLLSMRAAAGAGSAKLEALMAMLEEMLDEGRRVLLFSQFTSMLALIEAELKARSMPYVKLTGQTQDRDTPVRRFQAGEIPLFLISLKAGGTGLNLPAADTVIHYDPWWNPAVENQATDRAHRIGQDKPVFVYKLLVAGSVEEKILALQGRKKALADGLYGREANLGRLLAPEDLERLFAEMT
jgi:superfamily II DNA or RNA helicase